MSKTEVLPALLTLRQVAEWLQVDVRMVRKWIRAGALPALRISARITRIRPSDVERLGVTPAPRPTTSHGR
jgi:excisionase family DNA binding protein